MSIRSIQFDLGKVLVDFDWRIAADRLQELCDVPGDEIIRLCSSTSVCRSYELGRISSDEFFRQLSAELRIPDIESLRRHYSDIFSEIPANVVLPGRLRPVYHVGLISNTCEAHIDWLSSRHAWMTDFDRVVYSYKMGRMKPDAAMYQAAVQGFDLSPDEVLFVDDLEENVAGARKLGWHGIVYKKGENLEAQLKRAGIKF